MVSGRVGPKRLDPWVIAAVLVGVRLRFINLGAGIRVLCFLPRVAHAEP
jgi:hypothetical protein